MARTIDEIYSSMVAAKGAKAELSALNSTSTVSRWRLMLYIYAACAWTIENLFDFFKADVDETISKLKPHSARWYAEKAKLFQYGFNLPEDSVDYDNTEVLGSVVLFSRIIAYAAVEEQTRGLRIKVAKDFEGELVPLEDDELNSFKVYMEKVKDAGVRLNITSGIADNLKTNIEIRYNPLVLTAAGARLDGNDPAPIDAAIKIFLNNLPFNGVFSIQKFVDAIQVVDGVVDLRINSISARYGALPFSTINIDYTPDSGYLRILTGDLVLQFVASE